MMPAPAGRAAPKTLRGRGPGRVQDWPATHRSARSQQPARLVRLAEARRSRMCWCTATRSSGFLMRGVPSGTKKTYPDIRSARIPGRSSEIRFLSSRPSSFGILRSVITASITPVYSRETRRAALPSCAARTRQPSAFSTLPSRFRTSGSSSTIRIVNGCASGGHTGSEALMGHASRR